MRKIAIMLLCVATVTITRCDVVWKKTFENQTIAGKSAIDKCDITPNTKYKLNVDSEGEGELKLYFYDKDGSIPLYGVKTWKLNDKGGVVEFYSPTNTVTLEIALTNSEKKKLTLRGVELEKSDKETININPYFDNNSGYDESYGCEFISKDGKRFLKIDNSHYSMAVGDFIPVRGGEQLKVSMRRPNTMKKTVKNQVHYCECNVGVKFYFYDKNYRLMDYKFDLKDYFCFYSNWDNNRKSAYSKTIKVREGASYLRYIIYYDSKEVDHIDISELAIKR